MAVVGETDLGLMSLVTLSLSCVTLGEMFGTIEICIIGLFIIAFVVDVERAMRGRFRGGCGLLLIGLFEAATNNPTLISM